MQLTLAVQKSKPTMCSGCCQLYDIYISNQIKYVIQICKCVDGTIQKMGVNITLAMDLPIRNEYMLFVTCYTSLLIASEPI